MALHQSLDYQRHIKSAKESATLRNKWGVFSGGFAIAFGVFYFVALASGEEVIGISIFIAALGLSYAIYHVGGAIQEALMVNTAVAEWIGHLKLGATTDEMELFEE